MEDSDDDLGPEDDDAWLFEDLNLLLKLWTKRREKEGLLALIFEVSPFVCDKMLLMIRESLRNCCLNCRLFGRSAELYERHD
jgi:hypothetical protein